MPRRWRKRPLRAPARGPALWSFNRRQTTQARHQADSPCPQGFRAAAARPPLQSRSAGVQFMDPCMQPTASTRRCRAACGRMWSRWCSGTGPLSPARREASRHCRPRANRTLCCRALAAAQHICAAHGVAQAHVMRSSRSHIVDSPAWIHGALPPLTRNRAWHAAGRHVLPCCLLGSCAVAFRSPLQTPRSAPATLPQTPALRGRSEPCCGRAASSRARWGRRSGWGWQALKCTGHGAQRWRQAPPPGLPGTF